jgi:uncharacterized protein YbdZ (MbtH family)
MWDEEETMLQVDLNYGQQYSIWTERREHLPGWREVGVRGSRAECLVYIEAAWTDMRPRSVREGMGPPSMAPERGSVRGSPLSGMRPGRNPRFGEGLMGANEQTTAGRRGGGAGRSGEGLPSLLKGAVLSALLGVLALPVGAYAQDEDAAAAPDRRLTAAAVERPPRIDGRIEDAAWSAVSPATGFVQREPNPGEPASRPTEVRVIYGRDALFVAARMYDAPDSIAAQLGRRDATELYSDWFTVVLDSDDDRRSAFLFSVNPRGVRRDYLIVEDGASALHWDGVWEARTAIDSLGWTVEMRIPLSQLRFAQGNDEWGVNFQRHIARHDEISYWAPIPPRVSGLVSRFGRMDGMSGLGSTTRLQLQPYSMGRVRRAPGTAEDPFFRRNDLRGSVGGDFIYRIASNLTLSGTINPDFGQVEADPSEVNLTAFETFYDERRPFFTEGADRFEFGLGGGDELFYSRRIGRAPQSGVPAQAVYRTVPEASTILGAVKLTGRTDGGWSLGLLNAVTGVERASFTDEQGLVQSATVEPLTNYGILRVQRDLREGGTSIGGVATSTMRRLDDERLTFLASSAHTGGVDVRHRFPGRTYEASGWLMGSSVTGSTTAMTRLQRASSRYFQRPDASHLDFDPERTSLTGTAAYARFARIGGSWRGDADLEYRSPEFEVNDLGFGARADLIRQNVRFGYFRFRPQGALRSWDLNVRQTNEWTLGGEPTEVSANVFGNFRFNNHWNGSLQLLRSFPALSPTALRGGPALRATGYLRPVLVLRSDPRQPLRLNLLVNTRFDDEGGGSYRVRPTVAYRPSARTELSLAPSVQWNTARAQYVDQAAAGDEQHYFMGRLRQTTVSLTTRLNYTFSPALSLEFYAQPFLSAGRYDDFLAVQDPRAAHFDHRFRGLGAHEVHFDPETGRYSADLNGDGSSDVTFRNPDFNLRQLRSNAVLRWEYRPGSTLFVAWNQARTDRAIDGDFLLDRDLGHLVRAEGTHVLLVKFSYWLDL